MSVKLVALTKISDEYLKGLGSDLDLNNCERLMAYIARVSSSKQLNESYEGLLRYCLKKKHWSVFESVSMTLEIETSRAISAQILRHRSFTFQEFSQRYSPTQEFFVGDARLQDTSNRQSSIQIEDNSLNKWWNDKQKEIIKQSSLVYNEALENGIAKEVARFILPMSSMTRVYMTGNVRSWIHYIELRTGIETQKEHRELAKHCKKIFCEQFPVCSKALEWI